MPTRPLPYPARVLQAIRKAYTQGASALQIRDRFGMHPSTLRRFLREVGVPIRNHAEARAVREKTYQADFLARLLERVPKDATIRRYQRGASIRQLASGLGVTRGSLQRLFMHWGVDIRPLQEAQRQAPGRDKIFQDSDRRRIVQAFLRTGSATAVAREEKVHKSTVIRALKRWCQRST